MKEFIEQIKQHLINNDCHEAFKVVCDHGTDEILDKTSWELVPIIVEYLTEENFVNNTELFASCEKILNIIADKCNPAETVLLFLEQIENLENDVRFKSLLKSLTLCLNKCDLSRVIEWVISTIRAYTEALPLPENENPQLKEKTSIENTDPVIDRLISFYQIIINFLESLVHNEVINSNGKKSKVKLYLIQLHLLLFGKPFSHLNIENETDKLNIFHLSIVQMGKIKGNLLEFFEIIDNRCNKRTKKYEINNGNVENLNSLEIQLFHSEIPDLAYANYFYFLMSSKLLQHHIPHVYNSHYIMHSCFYLGNYLLTQSEYILVLKGLHLINNILARIENESIKHEVLELSVYRNLLSSLSQVMVYCDSMNERKMALNIFQNYIKRFNMRARHLVIIYLYETSNHSGFLALIINILKEAIVKSLNETPRCECFMGKKLESMLKRIYKLPNGSASDLVEISDEIIAALNLLRFIVIRDTTNIMGVWSFIDTIQDNYLKVLREGIDLARAHWKVKIKDLENQKKKCSGNITEDIMNDDVIVTVGGENLPRMPVQEKIKFCHQALNALDIIESISIRVNECIENNPLNNTSQH